MPASSRRWLGADDLVLIDELAHACICGRRAAVRRDRRCAFRHNDLAHAEALLDAARGGHHARADRRPTACSPWTATSRRCTALAALARDATTPGCMADDAHGIGVRRRRPRLELRRRTAGRRAAADGHAVEGDRRLWRLSLRLAAGDRPDAATAPAPSSIRPACRPASVAAAIAALDLIARDPAMPRCRCARRGLFTRALDLPEAQSPIVPVVIGDAEAALAASRAARGRRLSGRARSARRPCPPAPRGCASPSPRCHPRRRDRAPRRRRAHAHV